MCGVGVGWGWLGLIGFGWGWGWGWGAEVKLPFIRGRVLRSSCRLWGVVSMPLMKNFPYANISQILPQTPLTKPVPCSSVPFCSDLYLWKWIGNSAKEMSSANKSAERAMDAVSRRNWSISPFTELSSLYCLIHKTSAVPVKLLASFKPNLCVLDKATFHCVTFLRLKFGWPVSSAGKSSACCKLL